MKLEVIDDVQENFAQNGPLEDMTLHILKLPEKPTQTQLFYASDAKTDESSRFLLPRSTNPT